MGKGALRTDGESMPKRCDSPCGKLAKIDYGSSRRIQYQALRSALPTQHADTSSISRRRCQGPFSDSQLMKIM